MLLSVLIVFICKNVTAQHASIGIGAGLTGIEAEIGLELNNHLAIRGGVSILPYTYTTDYDLNLDTDIDLYSNYYQMAQDLAIPTEGLPTPQELMNQDYVNLDAKMNWVHGNALLDIYPFAKYSFHFTAGVYYQFNDRLGTLTGSISPGLLNGLEEANRVIRQLNGMGIPGLEPIDEIETAVYVGDYTIRPDDEGKIDAGLKVNRFKPYLGLGFGRVVPKKVVSLTFDLGVMFQGSSKIVSNDDQVAKALNEQVKNDDAISKIMDITVYPMLSLKLHFKTF